MTAAYLLCLVTIGCAAALPLHFGSRGSRGSGTTYLPGTLASAKHYARHHNGDVATDPGPYNYTTKYFTADTDNFNFFGSQSRTTYQQRYLINDTWWRGPGAPIFFYAGNEGYIELFLENAGFMWDLPPQFGALIVGAEHR